LAIWRLLLFTIGPVVGVLSWVKLTLVARRNCVLVAPACLWLSLYFWPHYLRHSSFVSSAREIPHLIFHVPVAEFLSFHD
jgi:hypothetical protein